MIPTQQLHEAGQSLWLDNITRSMMAADGGDAEETLAAFSDAGIDHRGLAEQLQREGAESFERSWTSLLASIGAKHKQLTTSSN